MELEEKIISRGGCKEYLGRQPVVEERVGDVERRSVGSWEGGRPPYG